MEREFVSYTEALALKEMGFDDPCFAFYQKEISEIKPTMVGDDDQYRLTGYRTCKNSEIPEQYISAPTYSQAFRWFRKKGQDSTILPTSQFYTPLVYNEIPSGKKKELYITYEEAELECLKKLIQFVKEK